MLEIEGSGPLGCDHQWSYSAIFGWIYFVTAIKAERVYRCQALWKGACSAALDTESAAQVMRGADFIHCETGVRLLARLTK